MHVCMCSVCVYERGVRVDPVGERGRHAMNRDDFGLFFSLY